MEIGLLYFRQPKTCGQKHSGRWAVDNVKRVILRHNFMKHTTDRPRTVGCPTNSPRAIVLPLNLSIQMLLISVKENFWFKHASFMLLFFGVRTKKCPAVEKQYIFTRKTS